MSPLDRKAGRHRLADMSGEPEPPWVPEFPTTSEWSQDFPISDEASYVQRLEYDEHGRLVEWAVTQRRREFGTWRRVVVYDTCHGKGYHVHRYGRDDKEFMEQVIDPIESYQDLEGCLDRALDDVVQGWQENERRSDCGH